MSADTTVALTAEDVLLGLRQQGYIPMLKPRQARRLALEYGAEFKQTYPWRESIPLEEIASLIADKINSMEAPNG